MELGTTIIGCLVLLLCIIPFIVIGYKRRLESKNKLQELMSYAAKYNSSIQNYELWGNSSIGIDETSHQVFFISLERGSKIFQRIELSHIENCAINNNSSSITANNKNYRIVEKITLCFSPKDKKLEKQYINIYHAELHQLPIAGELNIAEKWNALINASISKM